MLVVHCCTCEEELQELLEFYMVILYRQVLVQQEEVFGVSSMLSIPGAPRNLRCAGDASPHTHTGLHLRNNYTDVILQNAVCPHCCT